MMQPLEIRSEVRPLLQIHIHREEVGIARDQVLGARVGGVAEKLVRGAGAPGVDKLLQKELHSARSHPADEGLFDLIADEESDDTGMIPQSRGHSADRFQDLPLQGAAAYEIDMIRPGDADDQLQAEPRGLPQQWHRRRVIQTHRIETKMLDVSEIRHESRILREGLAA